MNRSFELSFPARLRMLVDQAAYGYRVHQKVYDVELVLLEAEMRHSHDSILKGRPSMAEPS
jgi:hypothetical protein